MEPIVGMDETEGLGGPYHYRNKAQFPIGIDKDGNIVTGFYAGRTHSIISNTNCVLGVEINERILKLILEFMKEHHISAYDEEKHQGLSLIHISKRSYAKPKSWYSNNGRYKSDSGNQSR